MTLFVLILLLIFEIISPLIILFVGLLASSFQYPIIVLTALVAVVDSFLVTVQFWWLFNVWYGTFVLGCVVILIGVLILGLIAQTSRNSISREKSVRINVSSLLLFGRESRWTAVPYALVSLVMLFVLYKVYSLSRGQITNDTITKATILFFLVLSLPSLVISEIRTAGNALKASLDPLDRDVFAINSLSGYGLAAWRAAFPFYFSGGTTIAMGYEISLSMVLVTLAATFAAFVIVPLLLGAKRYAEERNSVLNQARLLLERTKHINESGLINSLFEEERFTLCQLLNQMLISLYKNDSLLRFLAFWRWGPDIAFRRENNYWVLHKPAANTINSRPDQPLGVLERPWFQELIGPEQRIYRRPNDAFIELLASAYLKEIPSWNYRAAIFDDLVMIVEAIESKDSRAASFRARTTLDQLAEERSERKQAIVTAVFLAACTNVPSFIAFISSLYPDQAKALLRSAAKLLGGA